MDGLREVGLTQGLIDHLDADDRSDPLWYRCQPACYWRSSPISERSVLGLWECGVVVTYFDRDRRRYEQCSLEDLSLVWHSHKSLQGVLAVLFIESYEDGLDSGELRNYAEKFGFRHIERLLAEVPRDGLGYDRWRQAFPASCH
jgi:hypothetical protein